MLVKFFYLILKFYHKFYTALSMNNLSQSHKILFLNTLAFTICFACWTLNGVLVTFLVDSGIFNWSVVEVGWLLGFPILSGSIFRLPIGILTDKFGGKIVFSILLLLCAIPLFLLPFATEFLEFCYFEFSFWDGGYQFCSRHWVYFGLVSAALAG